MSGTSESHSHVDLGRTVVLQVRTKWKTVAAVALGFLGGYLTLELRLNKAITAAHEAKEAADALKAAIRDLATEREMTDTNRRIDDVVAILSHAQEVSKEPPNGKQRRNPRQ